MFIDGEGKISPLPTLGGDMDNIRFMMADARRFAVTHGLKKEASQIWSMVVHPSIKSPHTHEVRKGCFVELFEKHGLIDTFVSKYWPMRHTSAGEQRRQLYLDQKALNERLLSGLSRNTEDKEVLDFVADKDEESNFCEGREGYKTHPGEALEGDLLYSPNPRLRWEYAKARAGVLDKEIAERFEDWPRYWWGVANAWLVFVGPSPGHGGSTRSINWEKDRFPTLGKSHEHFRTQVDHKRGFWNRLREWTIESYSLSGVFIDDNEAALGSVLLANVLDTSEGESKKISTESLQKAMPRVVTNLELVRPRLIVPMEKRLSKMLIEELSKRGATIIIGPKRTLVKAKNQSYDYYKPESWQLNTKYGPLLVAESPQHPSRKNFYYPELVNEYLAEKIKLCL